MKTYFFIVAALIVIILSGGCAGKSSSDIRITVVAQDKNVPSDLKDMNKTAEVITNRLNCFFNIPADKIKPDIDENRIVFTISEVDTALTGRITEVMTGYSKLEFLETYENSEISRFLKKADNVLSELKIAGGGTEAGNPLLGILKPMLSSGGEPLSSCLVGLANEKDTALINRYLKAEKVRAIFPADIRFCWSAKPYKYEPSLTSFGLHAVRAAAGDRSVTQVGSSVVAANVVTGSESGGFRINLKMDSAGTAAWAAITRSNIGRCIAVVYNGKVMSYPRVVCEISGGNTEISGSFSAPEASELANILRSGELPFKLKIEDRHILERN